MSYILYKPIYDKDEEGNNIEPALGNLIRYFYSSANNNSLFDHPVEIHDRKTLLKFVHDAVVKISQIFIKKGFEDSGWKFHSYLHYEVVVYKTNLTIGNAVALPEHFYNQSNEKNLIKFDNYDDNLCFWRCLAVFIEIMEQSGGKIRYDRFEKPAKNLFMKFYDKDEEGNNIEPALGNLIRYFHSSANNNSLFVIPAEIHDRKTLTKFVHEAVVQIAELEGLKGFEVLAEDPCKRVQMNWHVALKEHR